jgi:predicted DCC family thiol-disulfide oxidoreductase YuxK
MRNPDRVFFDGGCGLCHRAVLFALARDGDGSRFRFAPLRGETFSRVLPENVRAFLPDSLVVVDPQGGVHTRSAAVVRILRGIGGGWGGVGAALDALPAPLLDLAYRGMAATRRKLFAAPPESCPAVPPHLRSRFDD